MKTLKAKFLFLSIEDSGDRKNGSECRCCGNKIRYTYYWIQDGILKSSGASCYNKLTRDLQKSTDKLAVKVIKKRLYGNKLNGYEAKAIKLIEQFSNARKEYNLGDIDFNKLNHYALYYHQEMNRVAKFKN